MCLIKKSTLWSRHKNVNGKNIILKITTYNNTLRIDVKYDTSSLLEQFILTIFLLIFNFIGSTLKFLSVYFSLVLIFATLYQLYVIIYSVRFERLIVAEKLGYQLEVHYNFGYNINYIAWQRIKSVFINEVISKQRVIFVLALLIQEKADDKIIPLFTNVMPRLQCLETIYQQVEIFHE